MPFINPEITKIPNQDIQHSILELNNVTLSLKREDQIHTEVSGNKFRKLKYNMMAAQDQMITKVLTFGGAYSNHIAATAAAAKELGLQSIGIIRGDELGKDIKKTLAQNETLRFAVENEMQLKFVSREVYRKKTTATFLESLKQEFGDFYLVPEGGTNDLAVKGCEEILTTTDQDFDVICTAVGTGGTISGIINSTVKHQKVLGFPALKGDFLKEEIKHYSSKTNWELITAYHFGGYGKVKSELIDFINSFKKEQQIQLDPVYTGKMMYGLFDMIKNGYFRKNTRILAIHTGGLQGIAGMNQTLIKKRLPLIEI